MGHRSGEHDGVGANMPRLHDRYRVHSIVVPVVLSIPKINKSVFLAYKIKQPNKRLWSCSAVDYKSAEIFVARKKNTTPLSINYTDKFKPTKRYISN